MIIKHSSSQVSEQGSVEYFTGSAHVYQLIDALRINVTMVTLEPGTRTVWHIHPLGQVIVIMHGRGLVQRWGESISEVNQGDVIWVEPGEKHWQGATVNSPVSYIEVTEPLNGKVVELMERVSDEEYSKHGPTTAQRQVTPFSDIAPALAHYTDHVLFGDVWNRPGLSPRDRSLVTVAALVALYRVNELPFHLRRAIENGVSKDELIELITHLAFYSGWPTASTALSIARKVFEELGVK
ncbi:cupin domain-containing carboxymuconolactone decarboxylase family protein [Caldivirga maquilingensis]|uniref:Carboxymuconolactone decarboxylase n=1 Tax=Caldivirga maquilingensis (strain ATCC 700844 / DSM 13496 / JCM 10307 / IC-167) TaxID=397948 RepID=A8MBX2_CALMQ|nr:carboxymuconolactone decarboxylase family protein [Caldivirga maquilingensis]ABW01315.1 Carboxymuconolactone decarboxylase [Caldivirga maquilingensis IC-167]